MTPDARAVRPPRLADLMPDGIAATRRDLGVALVRPWIVFAAFVVLAANGWWWLAVPVMALVFGSVVVVIHDLFHRNLPLSTRMNDGLVSLYGFLLLHSGHALPSTHRAHHRRYPADDDPEAYLDGWPIWRVVLEGPVYRFRLWRWALSNASPQRPVIVAEIAVYAAAWIAAVAFGDDVPVLRTFVVTAELGSWAFPIISVTAVHDRHADGPLRRTRTLRHPAARLGMHGMQYHLEHHLYPKVPASRLDELADAVEPWLRANGADIWGRGSIAAGAPRRGRRSRRPCAPPRGSRR